MPNTSSAKKMVRKIERRTAVNKNRRTRMRTFVRKVEEAIASGDQALAKTAFSAAEPEIMRGFQRHLAQEHGIAESVAPCRARREDGRVSTHPNS